MKAKAIMGTLAVVGTIASVALLNSQSSGSSTSFYSEVASTKLNAQAFQSFISTHHKSYITKQEFLARLEIYSHNYDLI